MDTPVSSLEDMTKRVASDSVDWQYRWFRGEPGCDCAGDCLVPLLYRERRRDGRHHNENQLLQHFRLKAPSFAQGQVPDREATDQWLFLARHVGLPTRLLDWTESLLVALHFALRTERPVIWMLNPIALNQLSTDDTRVSAGTEFPLTWIGPRKDEATGTIIENIGSINIRGAWEENRVGVDLPVAILPTYVHPRLSVQRSCFTVHGKDKRSLKEQVESDILKCYRLSAEKEKKEAMQAELRLLGVDHSTVFPDLEGLANELREQF